MKKVARTPPGLLADVTTLMAMAENFLDNLKDEPWQEIPRVWKRPRTERNKKGEAKTYYRWYCSWHNGGKTITKSLGHLCAYFGELCALCGLINLSLIS